MNNKTVKLIFKVIGIAAFIFIFYKLYSSWNEIKNQIRINSVLLFVFSLVILILFYFGLCIGWSQIINKCSEKKKKFELIYIFSKSQLARYLPGGVWNYIGRVAFLKSNNYSAGVIIGSILLESVLMVLSSLIIGVLASFTILSQPVMLICFVLIVALTIVLLANKKIVGMFYKLIKRRAIEIPQWGIKFTLILLLFYLLTWFLAFVSFAFLIASTLDINLFMSFKLGGSFLISWAAGFITPIPAGLGSREATLVYLLSKSGYTEISYFLSILSRFVMIISEALSFGVLSFINSIIRTRESVKKNEI